MSCNFLVPLRRPNERSAFVARFPTNYYTLSYIFVHDFYYTFKRVYYESLQLMHSVSLPYRDLNSQIRPNMQHTHTHIDSAKYYKYNRCRKHISNILIFEYV